MLATLPESKFQLTPIGIRTVGNPSFDEIAGALLSAWDLSQFSKWAQIDLLVMAFDIYGEQFAQLIDGYHYSAGTVTNMLWIGRNIPIHARVEGVSVSHHQVVAPPKYSLEEKTEWLKLAKENQWSRDELRMAVMGLLETGYKPAEYKPITAESAIYMVLDWLDGKVNYTREELRSALVEVLNERPR